MSITNKPVVRRTSDTVPYTIHIVDKNGVPIPLTTETFLLGIATTDGIVGSPDIKSVAGVIIDAATAQVDFAMDGTILAGNYFYDAEIVDTAGKKRTIIHGTWDLIQDIAK